MNINSKKLLIKAKEKHVVSEGIRINCISKEFVVSIDGLIAVIFSIALKDVHVLIMGIFFLYMGIGLLSVNIYYNRAKYRINQKFRKECITTYLFLIPTVLFSVIILIFFPGYIWRILGSCLLFSDLLFLLLACLSHYYYEK